MHVLVTGGAGFIGSHIVGQLVQRGDRVRVLDHLDPSVHPVTPELDPAVDLRRVDLTDEAAVADAVRDVDAVCHQAARVGLGKDLGDTVAYVTDNELGTAVLLRALFRAGFAGRFVLASSMVVYGEGRYRCPTHGNVSPGPRRPVDLDAGRFEPPCPRCATALAWTEVDEDAPLDPRSVYASTKVAQEHLCRCFGRETGCAVIALRYHNVYGPGMPRDTPYAGVASIFRSELAAGRSPAVNEDGGQMRDFVHVSDVARANLAALDAPGDVSGAFNIASGEPRTVLHLAWASAGSDRAPGRAPVVTGAWRPGDVRHVVASPARAAAVLGFRAATPFASGMAAFATDPLRPVPPP